MWTGIAIHHSAAPDTVGLDVESIRRWHLSRNWRDIGYHFVCEKVGDSYQVVAGRPLHVVGSHVRGHNFDYLGFCFVGDFSCEFPPTEQLSAGAEHVAGLCKALGIPIDRVVGHGDLAATVCPGDLFDIARFRDLVRGGLID